MSDSFSPRKLVSPIAPWPHYDEETIAKITDVYRSGKVNYWTGQEGREFEKEFSSSVGSKHAIALGNGSLALELAAKGLGLKPGDEIITTPRTFQASASCFVIHGIKPVFADIDLDSGNITPETVAPLVNERTRAIVPVHLGGWPCDMKGFMALAEQKKLYVIEDCAQANGAKIGDQFVGTFGHVNAWSFCQDKIITTGGEGGMVTTDREDWWRRMWQFKDHGKDWDAVYNREHPIGFRYVHEHWGTNWRLTDPQSAIGRVQLKKLPDWHRARTENAMLLHSRLASVPGLRIPMPEKGLTHAFYRFYVYVQPEALKDGWDRDRIMQTCGENGFKIVVGSGSEIYLEKSFQMCKMAPAERLPNAKAMGLTSLAFLVHPGMSQEALHQCADVLEDVMKMAIR